MLPYGGDGRRRAGGQVCGASGGPLGRRMGAGPSAADPSWVGAGAPHQPAHLAAAPQCWEAPAARGSFSSRSRAAKGGDFRTPPALSAARPGLPGQLFALLWGRLAEQMSSFEKIMAVYLFIYFGHSPLQAGS